VTVLLRASAGGHELLIDSASVRRVSRADEARIEASWPGRDLPFLDLSLLLGGVPSDPSDGAVILYGAGDDAMVVLAVDEVKGLVTLGPRSLMRLPPLSERFAQVVDAIAIEPIDGGHPLRLRARLDLGAIERDHV
jgi:hypothetical protein